MKKHYLNGNSSISRSWVWLMVLFGLFVPFVTQAQTLTVSPTTTSATPDNYGSVAVGAVSSPAKQYTVTGTGLSGNIAVSFANAPSFEGSSNGGNSYSSALTLPATGGTILVRFKPTFIGSTSDEYIQASANRGAANAFIDVVGTGTAGTPTITVTPTALAFGNQQVNTTSAVMSVTVNASSLTAPVTVTAPAGFQVSYNGQPYATQATIPNNGNGIISNAVVSVTFNPTLSQNYVANVTFASVNATTRNVGVSGTGTLPPAVLSANPTQLDFGTLQAGQVSTPQEFTITGSNITSEVTVNAPNGFLIRQGSSGNFVQNITLNPTDNSISASFQARFAPASAGSYNSTITANTAGNGGASANVAVTGNATAAPTGPFIVVNPANLDFGTVSGSGSAQTLAFSINAGNLTAALVLQGSNNNIVFRDASAGGDFVNGPITIRPASDGTVSLREIEVRLVAPVAGGSFAGIITASSTGAPNAIVTLSASSTGGNSTINVDGVLAQFSTVPGIASDIQSYFVTGTNLLQGLSIAAPQYFQVSLNATFAGVTGTGNSFVIPRNSNGDVPRTEVFVRFLPPSAISVTSSVFNSSSPATLQVVQANGTSEPSILIENLFQEVTKVVLNTKSGSQALNIRAKRVLKPIEITKLLTANNLNPAGKQQFELSLDNVNFRNTVTLTPNSTTYVVNQPIYVRYAPTYLGTGQSTLQFQSNDFANSSTQSFGVNDLLSGRSIDTEPTKRSTPTITRNGNTATVTFNLPPNYAAQGYGEARLIVASESANLPSTSQPEDGTPYTTGNQTYGVGPQIAPGFFVVYSGTNNMNIIDGLNSSVTYYFYTFEYNNIQNDLTAAVPGAENYLSPPVPNLIPGIESPGQPLPVTLVSFSARLKSNQVALRWETASELNNARFEVERSRDGRSFATILTLAGQGTTNSGTVYDEVDRQPLSGLSYYRLKQVDLDGKTSHSSLVTVNFVSAGEVVIYPNPVTDQLTISVGGSAEGTAVTVTDLAGRTISKQNLRTDGKLNMADLQAGTYLITIGTGDAKVTRRVVKQ